MWRLMLVLCWSFFEQVLSGLPSAFSALAICFFVLRFPRAFMWELEELEEVGECVRLLGDCEGANMDLCLLFFLLPFGFSRFFRVPSGPA